MNNRRLDYDEAVGILNALVIDKGEGYVYTDEYTNCVNWDANTGEPRCIVGHVVAAKRWVPVLDVGMLSDFGGCAVETLVTGLRIDLDRRTLDLLRNVQGDQDQGVPWGRAVEAAIEKTKDGNWVSPEERERCDEPF